MAQTISDKISLIGNQFIQSNCHTAYLLDSTAANNLPYITQTFTNFDGSLGSNIKSTGGTVYYKTRTSPSDWTSSTIGASSELTDINFTYYFTTSESRLEGILNELKICYNILDSPNALTKLKNYATMTVEKYTINGTTPTTANLEECKAAMEKLFGTHYNLIDDEKSNFHAVKRLLNAYIHIIHVYIAMKIEEPSNGQTPITDATVRIINDANMSFRDSTSGEYTTVRGRFNTSQNNYYNNLDTIDDLDTNLKELKDDVKEGRQKMESHSNIYNKNQTVYYVFFILFIVATIALLFSIKDAKNDSSKIIVGGVLGVSAISLVILYFLNMTYLKEGFTADSVTQLNLDNVINLYLNYTLFLSEVLQHAKTIDGMSQIVNKEVNRYETINHQLKLEREGIHGVESDDYRNARILQYRVYMFLQILIIVSLAVFIFLQTGENILVFGIALLLVLFMIYLYIMNTESLVHTDAKKIYWGEPSII